MVGWLLFNLGNGSKAINKMKLDSSQKHGLLFSFFFSVSGGSGLLRHTSTNHRLILKSDFILLLYLRRTCITRYQKANAKYKIQIISTASLSWILACGVGEERRNCDCRDDTTQNELLFTTISSFR